MDKGKKLVWDAAYQIQEGSTINVKYHSFRSDVPQQMEGKVTTVVARRNTCVIEFARSDGQTCEIRDDGILYSVGSNYPRTGKVNEINVR